MFFSPDDNERSRDPSFFDFDRMVEDSQIRSVSAG
jgi:hypothetical protein